MPLLKLSPYFAYLRHSYQLMFFLLFFATWGFAQDRIIRVTENLKPNVVALTVKFADGTAETGFGFITGEQNGLLYIVTAGHVVHGKVAQTPQKIELRFYSSLRIYTAEEESWFEADDLSLLTLSKPSTVKWQRKFAHFSPQTYQKVRFIGKNQEWDSPGEGEIFRLDKDRIRFTMGSIEPGTSGAPLIGEKGVIGLILEDERTSSVALSLSRIKELIGDARYPYFPAELYDPNAIDDGSSANPSDNNQPNTTPASTPPDAYGLVLVKGGSFTMGCTSEQGSDCYDWEKPSHRVTLSDFYIGKYEVTQAQWKAIMGTNPSNFSNCDLCPVEQVSWEDIQEFLRKLNAKTGKKYRLPTEAEWEYAARGGSQSRGFKYAGSNSLDEVAWYIDNSGSKTHPVGGKRANELGLYDMSGNVWEWCQDWYGDYSSNTQTNPSGAVSGSYRVLRGGSWYGSARDCRVSFRNLNTPTNRNGNVGFRLAL